MVGDTRATTCSTASTSVGTSIAKSVPETSDSMAAFSGTGAALLCLPALVREIAGCGARAGAAPETLVGFNTGCFFAMVLDINYKPEMLQVPKERFIFFASFKLSFGLRDSTPWLEYGACNLRAGSPLRLP